VTWTGRSAGSCAAWTRRVRLTASSRAFLTSGLSPARASSRACRGTTVVARSTPSKRAVYSRTASAPRFFTSSQSGRICATAASTSVEARGRTPARAVRVRRAGPRPLRSMRRRPVREFTRLVYGARPTSPPHFEVRASPAVLLRAPPSVLGEQDDQRGEAGPEDQGAPGPQRQRPAEEGAGSAGREQVVVRPGADVLAGPQREQRGRRRAEDKAGRRGPGRPADEQ